MPEKKEIVVEAKSIQEAIAIALKKLCVKEDEVEIRVLSEGTKGLFDMEGSKQTKIKVAIKERKWS